MTETTRRALDISVIQPNCMQPSSKELPDPDLDEAVALDATRRAPGRIQSADRCRRPELSAASGNSIARARVYLSTASNRAATTLGTASLYANLVDPGTRRTPRQMAKPHQHIWFTSGM